eukprot:1129206-Amphidinium_carterae.1
MRYPRACGSRVYQATCHTGHAPAARDIPKSAAATHNLKPQQAGPYSLEASDCVHGSQGLLKNYIDVHLPGMCECVCLLVDTNRDNAAWSKSLAENCRARDFTSSSDKHDLKGSRFCCAEDTPCVAASAVFGSIGVTHGGLR